VPRPRAWSSSRAGDPTRPAPEPPFRRRLSSAGPPTRTSRRRPERGAEP
jgi:hypothetical protein